MHVLWCNLSADWIGGAERYVGQTARALRSRGARCTLLYGAKGLAEPSFTDCFDSAFPWADTARQILEIGPDVVYVHRLSREGDIERFCVGPGVIRFYHDHHLFCPRKYKYTTLTHATCTRPVGLHCYPCLGIVQRSDGILPVRLRTVGMVRREQRRHRAVDAHVVGSRYMANHLVAHGFAEDRVHVLPLYVEAPPDDAGEITPDENTVLFVGAMLRGKGLDVLLDALVQLPASVRLIACGDGHQRSMFESRARTLGLASRVKFRGHVQREELDRLYRRASCVVIPSREPETFGFVGPEALLHGTPVIASLVGGMGEWLVDGVTGRAFESGDATALAGVLRETLESPEGARELAARGRARVLERFTAQHHLDALERLLERVIA